MTAERRLRNYAQGRTRTTVQHAVRREQDEMVCKCGKRWPVGEDHP